MTIADACSTVESHNAAIRPSITRQHSLQKKKTIYCVSAKNSTVYIGPLTHVIQHSVKLSVSWKNAVTGRLYE